MRTLARHLLRPWLLASLLVCAVFASPAAGQTATSAPFLQPSFLESIDDAQLHGTITPPGADTRHATAELKAYDSLVQAYPTLTADRLEDFFKVRRFGQKTAGERVYKPRAGVTVVRDGRWGEPAIYGETDEDMAFGAGFVGAEDRLAIMELLRALGRAEAFELLGTSQAWLADAEIARLYGYTEEEFAAMAERLPRRYGQTGADVLRILDSYVAGINEYIALGARGEVPCRRDCRTSGSRRRRRGSAPTWLRSSRSCGRSSAPGAGPSWPTRRSSPSSRRTWEPRRGARPTRISATATTSTARSTRPSGSPTTCGTRRSSTPRPTSWASPPGPTASAAASRHSCRNCPRSAIGPA